MEYIWRSAEFEIPICFYSVYTLQYIIKSFLLFFSVDMIWCILYKEIAAVSSPQAIPIHTSSS